MEIDQDIGQSHSSFKFRRMKAKLFQTLFAASAFFAASAMADEARVAAYTTQLRSVRVTEIPREAAKLVTAEKAETRIAAAVDVMTAALSVNSASTPLTVGAVAKAAPEAAASVAAIALKAQPKLVDAITKAAVSAAPEHTGAIVSAMCKARPVSFYAIGVFADQSAPKSSAQILPAITTALPSLKPLVERAQADFVAAKRTASLALVLKHTENILASISRDVKESPEALLVKESDATMASKLPPAGVGPPPVVRPPFVGGTPSGEIETGSTVITPASGRIYPTP